jgi:hypothetical protein
MGMTRATGGPVRCPWCARPVSDGPGSPEACPSCGVPLSPSLVRSRGGTRQTTAPARHGQVRRSQRLRAIATVLALTAVMLVISAIGVAAAVLRGGGSDSRATHNLQLAVQAAEGIRRNDGSGARGGFGNVTAAALEAAVPGLVIAAGSVPSGGDHVVSMEVYGGGDVYGWYGVVLSKSGHCFAAGTVNGSPKELTTVLPGNCTADAARASLMPLTSDTPTMAPTVPALPAPSPATSG